MAAEGLSGDQFISSPWVFYPRHAPGPMGPIPDSNSANAPQHPPVFVHRFVWRKSVDTADGDIIYVHDRNMREIFRRAWDDDAGAEIVSEFGAQPVRGLFVEQMDSGVLEVHID